ncbi:MAG: TRAP transporter substrate-binding protein DctP [Alphaproteobacteria bacterium]|jgi:TRAP-type transport system periplasmic protein|nr:TRAP transporter substrate-binding protein DctP [Alphaproteobacteria bacterium]MBU0805016.1 TRAP transporter substrate-binding protein DctP [Alphaproteobacteria bacterium]MBU0870515.1 TRAP transporter substrate-binding protein DctP [Alphaproteobacteria bacterium]MBU1401810.1 TRAP transporter substrate-binding protein DctP [Alphaproteobacteria bacterium]MBU1591773.1 TRAP transporter substrate-binding protein DctP [Alphaproteobacteria bacterium]
MKLGLSALAGMLAASIALTASAQAETLKASHQFPGGKGDARDEMVQLFAKELAAADVGLDVQVYPGQSLYKAKEQWGALTKGQLDITSFPLDYASGRVPQFSATLMPGLVRNHDRAKRLNASPFMTDIKKLIEDNGAIVIADAWLGGAFASKKNCITSPDTIKGQVTRAAGPAFEQMLVGAGASISSMASSEIYTGMQTGVLDATNTSSGSFVSYRLYEQVTCLTEPGENSLWFMYEPMLISKETYDRLTPEQQAAVMAAGKKAEEYFDKEAAGLDDKMVEAFKGAGVEVVSMSKEDYDAWLAIAKETAYKEFAEKVDGGQDLIDKALAVE